MTREEFPIAKAPQVLKNETIAVIGYGVQGPAQALNMRDNGFNVIIGQAKQFKRDWDRAVGDGWEPGKTLFDIEEAASKAPSSRCSFRTPRRRQSGRPSRRASSRATRSTSPTASRSSTGADGRHSAGRRRRDPGRAQGLGHLACAAISSRARASTRASPSTRTRPAARASAAWRSASRIGSGYLFPTTFQKEVYSDLTGERGVLMGALAGIMEAQYEVLRENGHSPEEAFNETVEELTQSLIRLVGRERHGLDVLELLGDRPARRARLEAEVPQGRQARVQEALSTGRDRQRDGARSERLREARLPGGPAEGAQ